MSPTLHKIAANPFYLVTGSKLWILKLFKCTHIINAIHYDIKQEIVNFKIISIHVVNFITFLFQNNDGQPGINCCVYFNNSLCWAYYMNCFPCKCLYQQYLPIISLSKFWVYSLVMLIKMSYSKWQKLTAKEVKIKFTNICNVSN